MKKLFPLLLLPIAAFAAAPVAVDPAPQSTVNYRGENLPVFAGPRLRNPKKAVAPRFPEAERRDRVEGTAVVTFLVGVDGKVSDVSVLSSKPTAAFGEAAKKAVAQWRYEPLIVDGRPTKFIVQYPVNFRLGPDVVAPGPNTQPTIVRDPHYENFGR